MQENNLSDNCSKKLGVDVELCHLKIYDNGKQCRVCGDVDIDELGRGWIVRYTKWFKYKKLTDYIIEAGIDVLYIRSFYNTTPQLLKMFKNLKIRGIKLYWSFLLTHTILRSEGSFKDKDNISG